MAPATPLPVTALASGGAGGMSNMKSMGAVDSYEKPSSRRSGPPGGSRPGRDTALALGKKSVSGSRADGGRNGPAGMGRERKNYGGL